VRELVTALFREIHFAELPYFWDGINSVVKGGNKLPHSKCEFRNSQKTELRISITLKFLNVELGDRSGRNSVLNKNFSVPEKLTGKL